MNEEQTPRDISQFYILDDDVSEEEIAGWRLTLSFWLLQLSEKMPGELKDVASDLALLVLRGL